MYSKQEVSSIKRKFWTSFGQYMKPVRSATGETPNWLNYKTGIRHIFFRMDAGKSGASIAIEIRHPDETSRENIWKKFLSLKKIFEDIAGDDWEWSDNYIDEDGLKIARIASELGGVSILNENDWPAIISFLKPSLVALDEFWSVAKDVMEIY